MWMNGLITKVLSHLNIRDWFTSSDLSRGGHRKRNIEKAMKDATVNVLSLTRYLGIRWTFKPNCTKVIWNITKRTAVINVQFTSLDSIYPIVAFRIDSTWIKSGGCYRANIHHAYLRKNMHATLYLSPTARACRWCETDVLQEIQDFPSARIADTADR
jgi:hypothetical protein